MSNTVMQIKRSVSNSTVTSLANGQLAFTANGYGINTGVLYIGNPNGSGVSVIGGSYTPGTLTNYQALVANSTGGINQVITANLTVTYVNANGSYGSTGQILTSNSTGGLYWSSPSGTGTVTTITMGNGLVSTQNPLTTSGTLSVNLASTPGLNVSSGGLTVLVGNGLIINSTGVCVNLASANSGLNLNGGGLQVAAANGISLTAGGINVLGSNGIISNSTGTWISTSSQFTVNASGLCINATGILSASDLTLTGNLTVSGTLTTLNTTTLVIKDNFIQLADLQGTNTTFTDIVDAGLYLTTGNTTPGDTYYSGIARIASLSTNTNPVFKLFSTNTAVNTSTINATAYVGTLRAFLEPWGDGNAFVVNSSAMAFTANSTISLSLVANTLSLTTALPATSGGTGASTTTAGDLLVGNSTNTWSKFSAGSDGQVLQWQSTTLAWGMLDGGTFAKEPFILNVPSTINVRRMLWRKQRDSFIFGEIGNIRGTI
jgi:hypothetical protein